jgi:hypothetical protein
VCRKSTEKTLASARLNDKAKAELEALLFRDVMGITASTLKFVAGLSLDDRTHADSLTAKFGILLQPLPMRLQRDYN